MNVGCPKNKDIDMNLSLTLTSSYIDGKIEYNHRL